MKSSDVILVKGDATEEKAKSTLFVILVIVVPLLLLQVLHMQYIHILHQTSLMILMMTSTMISTMTSSMMRKIQMRQSQQQKQPRRQTLSNSYCII